MKQKKWQRNVEMRENEEGRGDMMERQSREQVFEWGADREVRGGVK